MPASACFTAGISRFPSSGCSLSDTESCQGGNQGVSDPDAGEALCVRVLPLTLYHSISLRVLLKSLSDGHLNVSVSPTEALIG